MSSNIIFQKYPKIGQFRNVVKNVSEKTAYQGKDENGNAIKDYNKKKPVLSFTGTVKTHGTNTAVLWDNGNIKVQSRNRFITPDNDNVGFSSFVKNNEEDFIDIFEKINKIISRKDVVIYGEWIGHGIQKGVAVSELEKTFIIFDIKIQNEEEFDLSEKILRDIKFNKEHKNIYNIFQFHNYKIDIDFEKPGEVQNTLIELTEKIEKECPVGKFFNISGTGEGIVWKHYSDEYGSLYFKVKGSKHSVSKVKTLASVDAEKIKSIEEFLDYAVTENRLQQYFDSLFVMPKIEPDKKHTGDFIKAVLNDIVTEEADTMDASHLTFKDVSKMCSDKIRKWFFKKIDFI